MRILIVRGLWETTHADRGVPNITVLTDVMKNNFYILKKEK
jgi:hypothetical protein